MVLREDVGKKIYEKTNGEPGRMERAILRLNNLFTGDIYARKMLFDFHYQKAMKFYKERNFHEAAVNAIRALEYNEEGYLYKENGWSHVRANISVLDPSHGSKEKELGTVIEKALWYGVIWV
jgi:hypothetical protein